MGPELQAGPVDLGHGSVPQLKVEAGVGNVKGRWEGSGAVAPADRCGQGIDGTARALASKSCPPPENHSPWPGANVLGSRAGSSWWSSRPTMAPGMGPPGPVTVTPTRSTVTCSKATPGMFSVR
jgi:hypothetical protein